MELPRRTEGDALLRPGELLALRDRVRSVARRHDLTTVHTCAFDYRTRRLPFTYADIRMAPAGVRAIGAAMADVGFKKTRIVMQQWNRKFSPSQMRLDGRIPDAFMVSSMQLHTAACISLIRHACRISPEHWPLILPGGGKCVCECWGLFSHDRCHTMGCRRCGHRRGVRDVEPTGGAFIRAGERRMCIDRRSRLKRANRVTRHASLSTKGQQRT